VALRRIPTSVLGVAYEESGAADGVPVFLMHGLSRSSPRPRAEPGSSAQSGPYIRMTWLAWSPSATIQSNGNIHRHVGKPAWDTPRAHPDADA